MSGKVLGFLLDEATFYIHTSNTPEVARFGSDDLSTHVRIYSGGDSNSGFLLETSRSSASAPPDFAIYGPHLPDPSFFVQGNTGKVGINTSEPRHAFEVVGDFFLDGQIFQKGTNTILYSEVVQSGSLFADFITSCNVLNTINCTNSIFSNVQRVLANETILVGDSVFLSDIAGPALQVTQHVAGRPVVDMRYMSSNVSLYIAPGGNIGVGTTAPKASLHIAGSFQLEGEPLLHVINGVQRLQTCVRSAPILQDGSYALGFELGWASNAAVSEMDMIEVSGTCFASGSSGKRLHFRFHAFIDPRNNGTTLPGLDSITDQSSMTSVHFTKPKLQIVRLNSLSVRVVASWTSSVGGYRATCKLDATGPVPLGILEARPTNFV